MERVYEDRDGGVKLKIPPFTGTADSEAYLQWERKIEHVFDCNTFSENNKMKLAIAEFTIYWYYYLKSEKRRKEEDPIETWEELKEAMRKRFVPKHYERDLKTKLQALRQGTKSVAEYYREMETLIGRAKILEDEEDTMSRFLGGLNQEIAHLVDRNPPPYMEDMYHYAIKIEAQLKEEKERSKRYVSKTHNFSSSNTWNKDGFQNRNESMQSKGKFVAAKRVEAESSNAKKIEAPKEVREKTSSIQCWKCKGFGHMSKECVNKRVMVVRNGEINSEDECEENGAQLEEEYDTPDDEYIEEGNSISLITRRVLNVQIKEEKLEDQRENLFHTRCLIEGNPCSLVIDSGSCTNVVSSFLVRRLQLATLPHLKPYKLQWLTNKGELKVNSQALISFTLGRYTDEVLCDVVPMHAGDILLGRPWQYDREVTYDGLLNKYTFTLKGKKFTLLPLSPYEVHCDHLKLEEKRKEFEEQERREESKLKEREKSEKREESEGQKVSKNQVGKKSDFEEKRKNVSLVLRKGEVRNVLLSQDPKFVLMCKGLSLATEPKSDYVLPSVFKSLLQEFNDVFPHEDAASSRAEYIKTLHK